MFPIRIINADAPATLRFLQEHHIATAGFISAIAYGLDVAKETCANAVLRFFFLERVPI